MICSISGEVPKVPVVSKKTGKVYEKDILLKYVEINGKEPNLDEDFHENDLIEINLDSSIIPPRPPTLTSIPSLISVFQNEWDAVVLETFTLKQHYQQVRQELSQALYQNDAACRVIARLVKERDDARAALENFKANIGSYAQNASVQDTNSMDVDKQSNEASAEKALEVITETFKSLSGGRKKRKQPVGLSTVPAIKSFKQNNVIESMHSSTQPGILTVSVDGTGDLVLTGGVDGNAEIYQSSSNKIVSTLKGHTKKVSHVSWLNKNDSEGQSVVFTGSVDKTVRFWTRSQESNEIDYQCSNILKAHNSAISGLCVHPSSSYLISSSIDGAWKLTDISSGKPLFNAQMEDNLPILSCNVHPDGLILGTGSRDGKLLIWDVKAQNSLMSFDITSPTNSPLGPVQSLSFSENGYYLAASSSDIVQVFDLRKKAAIHTFQLSVPNTDSKLDAEPWAVSSVVNAVEFDRSGSYLAIAGQDTRVYKSKTWAELLVVSDNTMEVTGFSWCDSLSKQFVTSGMDRSLRFYGA
ncbi:hypothetical protein BB559_000683 [Furculomyces boomerangus]|uniref:Pre-mRNA-processing factor 19 n=2 Tax=Harpellales TaxID=61421 RepID=A0A2T9Z4E4_9FUNG|nr:hypothetical protein BB559_000683 [Furculomyces boomerangus]PWA01775.1 hypothetical protein BB558_002112 [Smittium angustum]PWA03101.1 hypothetical protein BB558_000729 [Smittium angustum]